jgi:hypothetical protein
MAATPQLPSWKEVLLGSKAFEAKLPREAMYKTATFLVDYHWGKPREMADGLGVLLLTWNQAFYRYGQFDFKALERCITKNRPSLEQLRKRSILDYTEPDAPLVRRLFGDFLSALAIDKGKKASVGSPVAVAKALHLLAPNFFPLWDDKIARGYGCYYGKEPIEKYLEFFAVTREIVEELPPHLQNGRRGRTAVKVVDEYNFARYTRGWV